jgi:hypothetical protein
VVHSGGGKSEAKNRGGGSELGHGDLAQGSGTPAASKASKACAWEREKGLAKMLAYAAAAVVA